MTRLRNIFGQNIHFLFLARPKDIEFWSAALQVKLGDLHDTSETKFIIFGNWRLFHDFETT